MVTINADKLKNAVTDLTQILEPLRLKRIFRNPLSKYCLIVYPPRNACHHFNEHDKQVLNQKVAQMPAGEVFDLYVHTPFCSRACTFCNFYIVPGLKDSKINADAFVDTIVKESENLSNLLNKKLRINSIYLGGGSPSLLTPAQLERIFKAIKDNISDFANIEITMELHPEVVRLQADDYLEKIKKMGITRISIGFQSSNQNILNQTRRGHTVNEFHEVLSRAKKLGFIVNVDLMWGFIEQTAEDHKQTLNEVISLNPDSITTYFLEIRPTSSDFVIYEKSIQEKEYQQKIIETFVLNRMMLEGAGYQEKTLDYWFKGTDFEHRKKKWAGGDTSLLSLGPGTYNWIFKGDQNNLVFFKPFNIENWTSEVYKGIYPIDRGCILDEEETYRRHLMFSVRQDFMLKKMIAKISGAVAIIDSLLKLKLITDEDDGYRLSFYGKFLNHEIASLFISEYFLGAALQNMTPEELRYACFVQPEFIQNFRGVL